jgi:hypothetical protein
MWEKSEKEEAGFWLIYTKGGSQAGSIYGTGWLTE